jgi:hypothetical protein
MFAVHLGQVGPEVCNEPVEELDDRVLVVAGGLEELPVAAACVGDGVGPLVLGAGGEQMLGPAVRSAARRADCRTRSVGSSWPRERA